jgi:phage-related protein
VDGPLDMSTVLTNGEPIYSSRTLTVNLECSEGTRLDREAQISAMVNQLDGRQVDIILPDDPTRYISGRVRVKKQYNDPAHAAVTVTAVCAPWRYNRQETAVRMVAAQEERLTVLPNAGRRAAVPDVDVSGAGAKVTLATDDYTWELAEGSYKLIDLGVPPGNTPLRYSGKGTVVITYREAVL